MKNVFTSVGMAIAAAILVQAARAEGTEYRMDARKGVRVLSDSHRYDLRPGLRIACRVKFDESPAETGEMTIVG